MTVYMIDLPGRGYSSTPAQTPQSPRFFTTCILLALATSPIPWTGNTKFSLVGYSLGGGIAMDFTSHFPALVSSLILLAPGGLVRPHRFTLSNKLIYDSGLLSERLTEWIVTRRLKSGALPIAPSKPTLPPIQEPASGEVPKTTEEIPLPLSQTYPDLAMEKILPWQLESNDGLLKAYISSMRHGPISNQQEVWERVGQRLNAHKLNASIGKTELEEGGGLEGGKVLIVGGTSDGLVLPNELSEDAAQCLGRDNFELKLVDAGHDLEITRAREIVDIISGFWKQ